MITKSSQFAPIECLFWPTWARFATHASWIGTLAASWVIGELDGPRWVSIALMALNVVVLGLADRMVFRPDAVEIGAGRLRVRGRRELEIDTSTVRRASLSQQSFSNRLAMVRNLSERLTGRLIQVPTNVTLELPGSSLVLSFRYRHEAQLFVRQIRPD